MDVFQTDFVSHRGRETVNFTKYTLFLGTDFLLASFVWYFEVPIHIACQLHTFT